MSWPTDLERCLVLIALVVFSTSSLAAEVPTRDDFMKRAIDAFEISTDYQTPHTNWNRPSITGPLKVLAIAPRWYHRESVELLQRFDVQISVFMSDRVDLIGDTGPQTAYGSATMKVRTDELMKKLSQQYDVIVVGSMEWSALPKEAASLILSKVRNGCGLVLANVENLSGEITEAPLVDGSLEISTRLLESIPYQNLPAFKHLKTPSDISETLRLRQLGAGRIAQFKSPSGSYFSYIAAAPSKTQREYEYALCLAYKAIQWAGKKECPVYISPDFPY